MNTGIMGKFKFLLLIATCLLFLGGTIFALPFDMILSGDPALEDLRFLSLKSGHPFLSFTPPLAPAEIENFLDSIDTSLLGENERQAEERIRQRLAPNPRMATNDSFASLVTINSAIEGRARSTTDIDWYPAPPKILPMVSLPMRLFFADTVQLYIEPFLAINVFHYEKAQTFGTNIHYDVENAIDLNMPRRMFFAAGGQHWNFQLGRDELFWGTGHTGSLSFSGNAHYFDFARISFFSRNLKYSFTVHQMPFEIPTEKITQRHFYLHRIDFTVRDSLAIGIMEGRITGNAPLGFQHINPLAPFFYDIDDDLSSFFSLEANWNIVSAFSVYGQFVMTDFALPYWNAGQNPSGLGFMAGLNLGHSFDRWASVFFLEYIYTYPYLYMSSGTFSSFVQQSKVGVAGTQNYFIGFPRDSSALTLGVRFFQEDKLSFSGELTWRVRGEFAVNDVTLNWIPSGVATSSFSGTPEQSGIATFSARWRPFTHFTFSGSITGIVSDNHNNNAGVTVAGGQTVLAVIFQY